MTSQHTIAARERIAWADRRIEDFAREAQVFIDAHDDSVVAEDEPEGELQSHRFGHVSEVPASLKHIFSEAVTSLMEPCENLLTQTAQEAQVARGKAPTCRISFPYFIDPAQFTGWANSYQWLPSSVLDVLEAVQPFNPHTVGNRSLTGPQHPLFILGSLWNHKKHEELLEIAPAQKSVFIGNIGKMFHRFDGGDFDKFVREAIEGGPKLVLQIGVTPESGAEVVQTKKELNAQVKVGIDVALREEVPGGGRFVTELLREIHGFVGNQIIARFEAIP